MRLLSLVAVFAVAACGRIGFDAHGDGGSTGDDARDGGGDGGFLPSTAHYLKASNTGPGDAFGAAVAVSADGNTIAVGAFGEDSATKADPTDNTAPDSGAVYVFVRSGQTWVEQAYLKSLNIRAGDNFGVSVALSDDGNTLAVGSFLDDTFGLDTGAVYLFNRFGTAWSTETLLVPLIVDPGDGFGQSVAISGDGKVVAIGAHGEDSVAGDPLDNSVSDAGAAYIFTFGAGWNQTAYIKASNPGVGDRFGESIALSADSGVLAVGAYLEQSSSTGIDGDQLNDNDSGAGAVYVYANNGFWVQTAYVKASNTDQSDEFGVNVALSGVGDTLLVGAQLEDGGTTDPADNSVGDSGAAYILERSGQTWSHHAYLKASNRGASDEFGLRVALSHDGSTAAVGAIRESSNAVGVGGNEADDSAPAAGAAYVYGHLAIGWTQKAYVKATNTTGADEFGTVSLSGDGHVLVVGAFTEDNSAAGVDGVGTEGGAVDSGAVYVYE